NSAILSRLLTKCEAAGNAKALAVLTQISPVAWRHILLNGHYTALLQIVGGDKLIIPFC
ncbi:Tn3 family transposase, partial [Escherichia coli]